MMKIFTLMNHVPKRMALPLFFCLSTLLNLTGIAQTPIVTNSATYDVFMNIDPSRGIDPTEFSDDVSDYLNTLGAPSGSYQINTSAVTLDPTDVTKWEVYDHYDTQWYANQTAWSASPGGFNNGNIPSNWYYYPITDSYTTWANPLNQKITIAQLLSGTGSWLNTAGLQSHIYPYVDNGKPAMQFYGYSQVAAADFLYYPADVASTKTVKFDIDATNVITHSMKSAGFLINGGTTGTGSSKTISGYLLLFTWPAGSSSPATSLSSVQIYKLTNVNVDNLHNSGTGAPGTLIATSTFNTFYTKSHIELSITSTDLTATIQQLDNSGNLIGSQSVMFNSQALTSTGFGGFGPFVLYSGHSCYNTSAFRFSNLEMAFGGVLSGNSSLESYQYAEYLDNSTTRFFVNLTNPSATNYAGTSNDMDNAYLTRMKEDGAILITDESTGTYLPGTLNENIKNTMDEPTDAVVAAALGLPNLSGLTPNQQLAAKVAYLIYNTTLGSYGAIDAPTATAVASLYLMDGPGTDAVWTGANQINEIKSWLVSGTSINIYLNPDNSVNATGLAATYTLTDPSGTKTTITTSVDGNGKLYFAFPKTSAIGEYAITLNYATGGSITSTVPSAATFNYLPVPPLAGTPGVSGTMQYGQMLTVTPNVTNNTGTLFYQWKANGANITNATGSTYTLTASEVGKSISCDISSNVESGTLSATASGTVTKITLTPTVSAVDNKIYNGTTTTTGGTISFSGTINSENPTYSATIVWTSANPGTSTVNVTGISLTSLADRYVLSVTSLSNVTPGNNATIGSATPTVSVNPTAGAITYGQTLQSSTLTTSSAVVNGFSGAITGSYAWKIPTTKPTSAGTFTTATVTFTPDDASYNSIDFDISVTVTKATLTVTAAAKTKIYGEVNPPLTFAYSGWQNSETESVLTTTPTASTTVDLLTNVGTHTDVITVSGGADENYAFTYVPADFSVTAATLTVTADAQTKVYGDANPTLTFQYSGWKNSETDAMLDTKPTASTTVDLLTNVGTHTDVITLSGGADGNYAFTYVPADFSVTAATLTATADAQTKAYGDANPTLTFQYSGWKNSETDAVLTTKPSATTTVTNTTSVGTYTDVITLSGGADENYAFTYVPADFSVTAATLTATADAQTKVYGDANPILTFQYSGWKNSETDAVLTTKPTASTTVTNTTSVGTYTDVITVSGGADENYAFTYVPADFSVTAATLTVTADAQTKVYGDANPTLTFQYSGWKNSETDAVLNTKPTALTTVDLLTNVGTHTNAITVSGGADNNYAFSYEAADFLVTAATLTVTADAQTKAYGDVNPTLTFQYSGWKNSDTESVLDTQPIATTTVTVTTSPGTYYNAITVSGGSDNNYNFTYIPASFTVNKGELIIWLDPKTKVYGDENPTLTYRYTGFMNGDDESDLDYKPYPTTSVTKGTNAGTYTSSITMTGGLDANYSIVNVPANFTVNKALLTVTADPQAKAYGEINPVLTFTYSGWKNGENETVLDVKPVVSTTVNTTTILGVYKDAIFVQAGSDNNYKFDYVAGTFTVTQASQSIVFNALTPKTYGDEPFTLSAISNSGLTISYTCSDSDVAVVSGNTVSIIGAGTAVISASQSGNANYLVAETVSQTLTVNRKPLFVEGITAVSKIYDGNANAVLIGGTLSGTINSDVITLSNATTGTFSQTSAGTEIPVATTMTISGEDATNYTLASPILYADITAKTVTVTAQNVEQTCAQPEQPLTYSFEPALIGTDTFTGTLTRPEGNAPGIYPITLGTLSLGNNYAIQYVGASYTIIGTPNLAPVVDPVANLQVLKNSKEATVNLTGIDPVSNCIAQQIESITASAENKTLIPEIKVDYVSGESTAKLTLKIADGLTGETTIKVVLKDNGGTENDGTDSKEMVFNVKVDTPVGINDMVNSFDASVYPNPTKGQVKIKINGTEKSTVKISNSAGIEVFRKTDFADPLINIDLSDKTPGLYLVEISNGKSVIVKKLIITN